MSDSGAFKHIHQGVDTHLDNLQDQDLRAFLRIANLSGSSPQNSAGLRTAKMCEKVLITYKKCRCTSCEPVYCHQVRIINGNFTYCTDSPETRQEHKSGRCPECPEAQKLETTTRLRTRSAARGNGSNV